MESRPSSRAKVRKINHERPSHLITSLEPTSLRDPLKSPEHIRILKLYPPGWPDAVSRDLPKSADLEIECDVYQILLDDLRRPGRPCFAALSYVWGDPSMQASVRCGGEMVSVTKNLYDALRWVRFQLAPRLLFVDSLSIDQSNEKEKSAQVRRMSRIFGEAHVVCFLGIGETIPDIDHSVQCLQHVALAIANAGSNIWELEYLKQKISKLAEKGVDVQTPPFWLTLKKIIESTYFQRVWCLQEYHVSRSSEARIASCGFDMDLLCMPCLALWTLSHEELGPLDRFSHDQKNEVYVHINHVIGMLSPRVHGASRVDHLAKSCISRSCSDEKDHVFAVAGLFESSVPYPVDYSAPLVDVFAEFVIYCIKYYKDVWCLYSPQRRTGFRNRQDAYWNMDSVGVRFGPKWTPGLPSWCPDYACCAYLGTRDLGNLSTADHHNWNACGGREAKLTSFTHSILVLRGRKVGHISSCKLYSDSAESDITTIRHIERIALKVKDLYDQQVDWRLFLRTLLIRSDLSRILQVKALMKDLPVSSCDPGSIALETYGPTWLEYYCPTMFYEAKVSVPLHAKSKNRQICRDIDREIVAKTRSSRFFLLEGFIPGFMTLGTGPDGLRVGDIVCVLEGGRLPFVLREVGNKGHFKVIGDCYVDTIMHGEAMQMGLEEQSFALI